MTPSKPFDNGAAASTPIADAGDMAQRGIEAVRGGSRDLRDKALDASDRTVAYIKDEPVKAMLIAAATGAALMALVTMIGRTRHPA